MTSAAANQPSYPTDEFVEWVTSQYANIFPWANAEQLRRVEANQRLMRGRDRIAADFTDFLADFGITPARYVIARLLFLAPDHRLPLVEISKQLRVTTPNITKQVDWLAGHGWVVRVPHATDRRVVYAQLTPEGERQLTTLFPAVLRHTEQAWAALEPAEIEQFIGLLKKLMNAQH